jgi:hypothetical protein
VKILSAKPFMNTRKFQYDTSAGKLIQQTCSQKNTSLMSFFTPFKTLSCVSMLVWMGVLDLCKGSSLDEVSDVELIA